MVKPRTLEEIHSKEYGHSKFAWFCDHALACGYEITQINEYQSKFKFRMNGYLLEFDKNPKANAKWQYDCCVKLIDYYKQLEQVHLER